MAPTLQPVRLAERWFARSERPQPLEGVSSFFARYFQAEKHTIVRARSLSSGHSLSTLSAIVIAGVLGGAMVIGFCESFP